jgi:methylthioribose-1-phosphate isomerase
VSDIRPIEWETDHLRILDQTLLPSIEEYRELRTVNDVILAIQSLAVRGAPALGAVGAYGVVIAFIQAEREQWTPETLGQNIRDLRDARPTAVNLAWAVDRVSRYLGDGIQRILDEAQDIENEDREANLAIANNALTWLDVNYQKPSYRILTHCNTGTLATTYWGTALGVIRALHLAGKVTEVLVDETRPLLQGSRLTAWELEKLGIPYRIQVDSAAAGAILGGMVDFAIVGADRIAKNGDTANKVGTLSVALACKYAGVPFFVAAPTSTFDQSIASGNSIEIEERNKREVLNFGNIDVAPIGSNVFNPAFDVTPGSFVTHFFSETKDAVYRGE